jgi:hypothetical protein
VCYFIGCFHFSSLPSLICFSRCFSHYIEKMSLHFMMLYREDIYIAQLCYVRIFIRDVYISLIYYTKWYRRYWRHISIRYYRWMLQPYSPMPLPQRSFCHFHSDFRRNTLSSYHNDYAYNNINYAAIWIYRFTSDTEHRYQIHIGLVIRLCHECFFRQNDRAFPPAATVSIILHSFIATAW